VEAEVRRNPALLTQINARWPRSAMLATSTAKCVAHAFGSETLTRVRAEGISTSARLRLSGLGARVEAEVNALGEAEVRGICNRVKRPSPSDESRAVQRVRPGVLKRQTPMRAGRRSEAATGAGRLTQINAGTPRTGQCCRVRHGSICLLSVAKLCDKRQSGPRPKAGRRPAITL
jgi:hypothetical protein